MEKYKIQRVADFDTLWDVYKLVWGGWRWKKLGSVHGHTRGEAITDLEKLVRDIHPTIVEIE